jgi:hypothetical protein
MLSDCDRVTECKGSLAAGPFLQQGGCSPFYAVSWLRIQLANQVLVCIGGCSGSVGREPHSTTKKALTVGSFLLLS